MPVITASELIRAEKQDNYRTYGYKVDNVGMAEIVVTEIYPLLDGVLEMLSPQAQMWIDEHYNPKEQQEKTDTDARHSDFSSVPVGQTSVRLDQESHAREGLFAHNRVLVEDT